ncbi:restriction endonuclease subunit S [Methylohalobius crimeensis]|uniref:restriction endonuclease subunit S n=1 Tax=Methylohalobius crimeensis TaxID=244365 RepID=UPI0003B436BE|nr:restriction endonuclease subunit S [Methylohalobius crimeensis]
MTVSENERVIADERTRHWKERKLKFVSGVRTSNVDKHVVEGETAVRLCNYTDVYYHEKITPDMPFMQGSATESEIERFGLKKGQVLLTKDSESWEDIAVPAYVADTMPDVVCGYHLAIIEPDSDEVDGRFLSWLAQSPVLNDQFKLSAKGVTRFGLSQQALKNALIDVPPLEYQLKVAAFLDRKTAEIDTLIAKKRRLLDRLAEKRTALITRAVTKGLNPDAPMKDSGIEWLGEIPAHWNVVRLRHVTQKIEQGWSPQCENRQANIGEWGVLKVGCVNGNVYNETENKALPIDLPPKEQYEVQVDDVLVSRANTKELLGSATLVNKTQGKILLCDKLYRLETNSSVHNGFLIRVLRSRAARFQYERDATGTSGSMQNIGQDTLKDLRFACPPLEEQKEIETRLIAAMEEFGQLQDRIESAVSRLEEYRSALITNAVTGQIKVA